MTVLLPTPVVRSPRSRIRWTTGRLALLLGVASAAVSWVGSWNPSLWGDEAASVMSAQRTLPNLLAMLGRIDAVHGTYYAFLHVWVRAFGSSELAVRTPSAIAVGLVVGGTVVLTARFADRSVALLAGAACAVLPRVTYMATDARSYAISTAAAVWLTVALVTLVQNRTSARWAWAAYGVLLAGAVYVHLYLAAMAAVHAVFLVLMRPGRRVLARWAAACGLAAVLVLPLAVVASRERAQVAFLWRRGYATPFNVVVNQWFGSLPLAVLCWLLVAGAVAAALMRRRGWIRESERPLVLLGAVWLLLPTTVVLLGNALSPLYNIRYLSFSAPAAGILVALGVAALARIGARLPTKAARAAPAILAGLAIVALAAPVFVLQRGPYAKDKGSDWRQMADYVAAHAAPGESVVFDQATKPSRDPRLALRLYPAQFGGLEDVELVTPFDLRSDLWDLTAPLPAVLGELTPTVWAIELQRSGAEPDDVRVLEAHGYSIADAHRINRSVVYRLVRTT